jgi:UDP-glucose 4-epimerase
VARYLVTGGAGFIGSHLVDALLARGHAVRVLDDLSTGRVENLPSGCMLLRGDVADPEVVRRAMHGIAGCFHLAAVASVARANEDWLGTHRVNQTGTVVVLDEARRLGGVPVVYASSAAVYGRIAGVAREDIAPAPLTAYGADKLGSELHARVAALVHGVPTLGLRFFNVYGPRQDPRSPYSGVISLFADAIGAGRPVRIYGDGYQSRDFVFVGDVVAHMVAAMARLGENRFGENGAGAALPSVLNVCTGEETSVLQLVDALAEACGRAATTLYSPARLGDIRRSVGSPALAISRLAVQARMPLREGLAATLRGLALTTPPHTHSAAASDASRAVA